MRRPGPGGAPPGREQTLGAPADPTGPPRRLMRRIRLSDGPVHAAPRGSDLRPRIRSGFVERACPRGTAIGGARLRRVFRAGFGAHWTFGVGPATYLAEGGSRPQGSVPRDDPDRGVATAGRTLIFKAGIRRNTPLPPRLRGQNRSRGAAGGRPTARAGWPELRRGRRPICPGPLAGRRRREGPRRAGRIGGGPRASPAPAAAALRGGPRPSDLIPGATSRCRIAAAPR